MSAEAAAELTPAAWEPSGRGRKLRKPQRQPQRPSVRPRAGWGSSAALTVVALRAGKEVCRKLIPTRFAPPEVSLPGFHPPSSLDFRVHAPPFLPPGLAGGREPRGLTAPSFLLWLPAHGDRAFPQSGPRGARLLCGGVCGQKGQRRATWQRSPGLTKELPFPIPLEQSGESLRRCVEERPL